MNYTTRRLIALKRGMLVEVKKPKKYRALSDIYSEVEKDTADVARVGRVQPDDKMATDAYMRRLGTSGSLSGS
jgi:hypothetical protein